MKTDSEVNNISLAVKKLYLCRLIITLITVLTKKECHSVCNLYHILGEKKQMNLKKEKEKLYSRKFTKFGLNLNVFVSLVTALLVLAFSIFTIIKPTVSAELLANTIATININRTFYWLYTINMILLFIGFSKFGNIKEISKRSLLLASFIYHTVYTFISQETSVQLLKIRQC